jgi:hypothetical protein
VAETRYPVHAKGVASRLVEGEAVVVVPSRCEVHVLNETASLAWALMDGTRSAADIAREIAERYSQAEAKASREIDGLLAEFESLGAVGYGTGPAASLAPPGEPPEPTSYEPPAVVETQPIEVIAGLCSSVRLASSGGAPGGCRALGACQKPFE